ncbi:hypothetical protein DUI70_6271 [Streptomyces albus]|nr:hypothetical protein DUI70_6271 [Streptomyces albus]
MAGLPEDERGRGVYSTGWRRGVEIRAGPRGLPGGVPPRPG